MQPANPATFFVTGSDEESFTFEPGSDLHYVIIRGKNYIMISTLLMANSAEHARDIMWRMVDFMEATLVKYRAYKDQIEDGDKHDFIGHRAKKITELREALTGAKGWSVHIGLAPRDQMYKVGWASNDTW